MTSRGGCDAGPQGTTLTWSHVRPCVLLICRTEPYGDALALTIRNRRLSVGYCGAATNPDELISTDTEVQTPSGCDGGGSSRSGGGIGALGADGGGGGVRPGGSMVLPVQVTRPAS